VLLVALPGTVRILQLRAVTRRRAVKSATGASTTDRRPDEPVAADQRGSSIDR
jgi:hypothetical protein